MGLFCKDSSHFLILFTVLIFTNTLRGVYEGFNSFFCYHKRTTDPIDLDVTSCGSFANLNFNTNEHVNMTADQYVAACGGSWVTADHCHFTFSNGTSNTAVVCDRYDFGDYALRDACAFLPDAVFTAWPQTNQSTYFVCKLSQSFTTCGISVSTYKVLFAVQFIVTLLVSTFLNVKSYNSEILVMGKV